MAGNLALFQQPFVLLPGFALPLATQLMNEVEKVAAAAPFRHMSTPGGFRMSVAMTNCGSVGWVTDRQGYRYADRDPETQQPWPQMPFVFHQLATDAAAQAAFENFVPDACLINRYQPGARMTLHQDKDERDFSAPIVSLSLGLPATFLFGGMQRKDPTQKIPLQNGDIIVWGGESRMAFHGINVLKDGNHPLTGNYRYNLTFRKAL